MLAQQRAEVTPEWGGKSRLTGQGGVAREPASIITRLDFNVAKPELGTKRMCPSCGTKYYDLNRSPITCPNCGTIFEVAAREKAAPERAIGPGAEEDVEKDEEIERDADVISLEAVEDEDGDVTGSPEVDEEDEVVLPEPDALEIEMEPEAEDEAAPFLEDEEEGGDDVSGLLDVEAEDEDEV